ncbi:PREDICTED: multidrug resistance-associated protein 4-like [Bison bison bison]|uniref:Multidrug resistance-associated protein 4-like n=1 Tax=Bison bison bison TaxID=43346 RepID=A0A6P3GLJ9_BISBB|nr:PREDICTED: multidrug resistance-associated protein 4-like [Bison bison bison]
MAEKWGVEDVNVGAHLCGSTASTSSSASAQNALWIIHDPKQCGLSTHSTSRASQVKTNPLQKANFCSRLFVWWLNPLFKIGHKWKLEPDDMYSVLPEDRSQRLGEELQGYWDQEVKRAQKDAQEPSLVKAIVKCYWKSYLIGGMFTFLEEAEEWLLVAKILWAESNH